MDIHRQKNTANKEMILFIDEAMRFVRAYGGIMETSTPHIYLSSIGFIPPDSPLHKAYAAQFPGGIKVASGNRQSVQWTTMVLRIQTSSDVNAVELSPNGRLIVCGLCDNTIQVLDAYTGRLAISPLQGHTSSVTSVAFSLSPALLIILLGSGMPIQASQSVIRRKVALIRSHRWDCPCLGHLYRSASWRFITRPQ